MLSKRIGKWLVSAGVSAALLLAGGGPSPVAAFSVDVKGFSYEDDSGRWISYDFLSGSVANNAIQLPEGENIGRPAGETGTTYFWGQAPGVPPVSVTLDTAAQKATLAPATPGEEAVAVLYAGGPNPVFPQQTMPTGWFYTLDLANFQLTLDGQRAYEFEVGLGRDESQGGPYYNASVLAVWVKGFHDGTLYPENTLILKARVSYGDTDLWSTPIPLVFAGLDPAQTTLMLDLEVKNGNQFFAAATVNGGDPMQLGSHTLTAGSFERMPALFPYLFLTEQTASAEPQATVQSMHFQSDGNYYANFAVQDPLHKAAAVRVTGANNAYAGTGVDLVWEEGDRRWAAPQGVLIGSAPVTSPWPAFTFTFTPQAGQPAIDPQTANITGYVTEFASGLQPAGSVDTNPVFSWNPPSGGADHYGVELNDGTTRIWNRYGIPASQTSATYDGPALATGKTYHYNILSMVEQAGVWNFSLAHGSFTYTGTGSATISFSGVLKYPDGTSVVGGRVEDSDDGAVHALTGTDGSFTVEGLPAGQPFTLRMTLPSNPTGYLTSYTAQMQSTGNITASRAYTLFPAGSLGSWGVTSGGAIRGSVIDGANPTNGYVRGAVVSYQSARGRTYYQVRYQDASGNPVESATGTLANGRFFILGVEDGDTVTVTVSQARGDYTFPTSRVFQTRANAVSLGSVSGVIAAGKAALFGYLKDNQATPQAVAQATVEQLGASPTNSTASLNDGLFNLAVPQNAAISLKFSKTGYAPTYTAQMNFGGSPVDIGEWTLFPSTQLATWGVATDKGIIRARVRDQAGTNYIAGATVSYTSDLGHTYQVCYDDGCTASLTATQASGRYVIKNVIPGDTVRVTAEMPGYTFSTRIYQIYAGGVHQGSVRVTGTEPVVTPHPEAATIEARFEAAMARFHANDFSEATGFAGYLSAAFLESGMDKARFLAMVQAEGGPAQQSWTIQRIVGSGNLATLHLTWADGQQDTLYFYKEGSLWLLYGNQKLFDAWAGSGHEIYSTNPSPYWVSLSVRDPEAASGITITAVKVTGPGLPAEGIDLHHEALRGQWHSWSTGTAQANLSPAWTVPPAVPLEYTFTIGYTGGTPTSPEVQNLSVESFVEAAPPQGSLSPAAGATVTGPLGFSWAGAGTGFRYRVEIDDGYGNRIWDSDDVTGTSVVYDGPALVAGAYSYNLITEDGYGNISLIRTPFGLSPDGSGTISFSGHLTTFAEDTPVAGAQVEMVGNPSIATVTAEGGGFTLENVPAGTDFSLKITGNPATHVPTYTAVLNSMGPITSARGFNLFTPQQLSAWGVAEGRGLIRGRILNGANPLAGYVSGATVTCMSEFANTYPVKYEDNGGNFSVGTGTSANGKYYVFDVEEGDTVTCSVTHPRYGFPSPRRFVTHAGAVSQGSISGSANVGRVAIGGLVVNTATPSVGIKGVTVEQVGATLPINATTSNGDGSYYLTVPRETSVHLRFSKPQDATLAPTYSPLISFSADSSTLGDFNLFPKSRLGAGTGNWNLTPGKGIIRARVRDSFGNYLSGAVVSATSVPARSYVVCYDDACTSTSQNGGSTLTDGRYVIKNVEPGDTVTVTAAKGGYSFNSRTFLAYGDSVHQGSITGIDDNIANQEQALRSAFDGAVAAINAGNLQGFMSFVSGSYLDNGESRAAFEANVGGLIAEGGTLAYQFGTITFDTGTATATVPVTLTVTIGGRQQVDQELLVFRSENGNWLLYGNQFRHEARVNSQHWASGYYAAFGLDDPGRLTTSVTVTGPGLSSPLALTRHEADGGYSWWSESGGPFLGTAPVQTPLIYTFEVKEGTETYTYERQITGWVEPFATSLLPAAQAGGPVIFNWSGIPGAADYSVELSVQDGEGWRRIWNSYDNDGDDIPPSRPYAIYTGAPLEAGRNYLFWVVARDAAENASFAEGQFTYTGPAGISFSGQVTTGGGAPLPGVIVTIDGNPFEAPLAQTDASGNFTLSGLPAGSPFALKMAKAGYRTTYSRVLLAQTDIAGGAAFSLLTEAETTAWPMNFTEKGAIATRVVDAAGNNLAGVTLTAASLLHPGTPYAVTYRDEAGNFGGSSTYGNGRFYVLGVDDGDIVTVTATRSGFSFPLRSYWVHAGGINQGRIVETPPAGTVTFSGKVNDSTGQPVAGAAVQVVGNPSIAAVTATDGSFALTRIPAGTPFTLAIGRSGYVTAHSAILQLSGPTTASRPFVLFTQTQLSVWGIGTGSGTITGVVVDGANPTTGYVAGATLSATSTSGAARSYPVIYLNDDLTIASGATSTRANGRYLVAGVDPGDTVRIAASKSDWTFQPRNFVAAADVVSIGSIQGTFHPLPKGDIDGNGVVNLADALLALQAMAGLKPAGIRSDYATSGTDVDGDAKIGAPEALHVLQVISGLRIDPFSQLQQEALGGVNASLALFRETWNAHGLNYDYLPFFHQNYLNDGMDRQAAVSDDMPPAGFVINSYVVERVVAFDPAARVITVDLAYAGTVGGFPQSGIDREIFSFDAASGKWLRYGNQRVGEYSVWLGKSRTIAANGAATDRWNAHFHLRARTGVLSQVVVSGPAGWTQTFTNRESWDDDPGFETFVPQDTTITWTPQSGDVYTFTAQKTAGGTEVSSQTIGQVVTSAPNITSPASHSLAGLAGTTVTIEWTLPDPGIGPDDIQIESSFAGPTGNVRGVVLSPTRGYINIPAGATAPAHIDVRVHFGDEVFTNCRFEFGS